MGEPLAIFVYATGALAFWISSWCGDRDFDPAKDKLGRASSAALAAIYWPILAPCLLAIMAYDFQGKNAPGRAPNERSEGSP